MLTHGAKMLLKVVYEFISLKHALSRILRDLDNRAKNYVKQYKSLIGKQCKLKFDIEFLEKCLREGLMPKSIQTRLQSARLRITWENVVNMIQNDLISKRSDEKEAMKVCSVLYPNIVRSLSTFNLLKFQKFLKVKIIDKNVQFAKSDDRKHTKFTEFISRNMKMVNNFKIINLSNYNLSEIEKEALAFGLNLPIPHKIDWDSYQAEWENLVSTVKPLCTPESWREMKKCLSAELIKLRKSKSDYVSPLAKQHVDAVRKLQENDDIVLTKPDKGTGVVIMSRTDYVNKMIKILKGSQFKVNTAENSIKKCVENFETKTRELISEAEKKGEIPKQLAYKLKPRGSRIPILYGLPKIHKEDIPTRPICSMSGSAVDQLSSYLDNLIKPALAKYNCYASNGSFEFAEMIRSFEINTDDKLISFDVVSLFTNVPLSLAIRVTTDLLYDSDYRPKDLTKKMFEKLLKVCVKDVPLLFNGVLYRQVDGVAMGSRLGPTLANATMAFIEKRLFKSVLEECKPKLYTRYVDDVFCIFNSEDNATKFLERMNKLCAQIKFTMEKEQNEQLPFLDVMVTKKNDHMETSIYRKPTFTGLYLNYFSNVPSSQKRSLISCLFNRIVKICSPNNVKLEAKKLENILLKNNYPLNLIRRIGNTTISRLEKSNEMNVLSCSKKKIYVPLPFMGDEKHNIATKNIRTIIETAAPATSVNVFCKSKKLASVGGKDKLEKSPLCQSNVVYLYKCACSATYVGRSERKLESRLKEHIPAYLFKNSSSDKSSSSHICKHLIDKPECIASSRNEMFDRFSILTYCNRFNLLDKLESIFILRLRPSLNGQLDTFLFL